MCFAEKRALSQKPLKREGGMMITLTHFGAKSAHGFAKEKEHTKSVQNAHNCNGWMDGWMDGWMRGGPRKFPLLEFSP
ncbi:hypothetical protein POVWA2_014440 [Plasmodium ovale wallikeri]|uniref:Uncharacterized protein n=1 Tax=Plasmodium ovale wallikeri TaxID=864142 RepID=A0A1A8YP54_PLAOA|nr:hypothetical protein POVWA2_014440 [Plasmodium ovale wallikeri]